MPIGIGPATNSADTMHHVYTGNGNDKVDVHSLFGNLYVVTTNGNSKLYTKQELDNTVFHLEGGNDRFTASRDVMASLHVRGGSGDDRITGGGGNDDIDGGQGNDTLFGSFGADAIRGGAGDDILDGSDSGSFGVQDDHKDGDDWLDGGSGNDRLFGFQGRNTLIGGDGRDHITAHAVDDVYYGNFGDRAGWMFESPNRDLLAAVGKMLGR